MEALKRLLFAALIVAVIVVMALRGCPRSRRGKRKAYDSPTATAAVITKTTGAETLTHDHRALLDR
jgi:hypothetical protein